MGGLLVNKSIYIKFISGDSLNFSLEEEEIRYYRNFAAWIEDTAEKNPFKIVYQEKTYKIFKSAIAYVQY
jgi:hypothetical protein